MILQHETYCIELEENYMSFKMGLEIKKNLRYIYIYTL